MSPDQSYYCVIPSALIADPDISASAKLAYGIISSLAKREGYAWVSNATLGAMVGDRDGRTAKRWIEELVAGGWLRVTLSDGENVDTLRKLWIAPGFSSESPERRTKMSRPHDKNVTPPMTKMSPNNTIDNTRDKDYAATQRETSSPGTALEPIPEDMTTDQAMVNIMKMRNAAEIELCQKLAGDTAKTLEADLWRRFLDIQPDKKFPRSAYAKERLGVKRIVAEAMARQPEAPEEWIAGYLAAWKRCHDRRDSCFKGQPFTPSVMGSGALMVRALEEMAKDRAAPSVDQEEIPWR